MHGGTIKKTLNIVYRNTQTRVKHLYLRTVKIYDLKTAPIHHKNAQKNHILPHSRTPLGRVFHNGYRLR